MMKNIRFISGKFGYMAELSKNWITEKHVDFEYKKYVLLAYLQDVDNQFRQNKLYPYYSDLRDHYRNLKTLDENVSHLASRFKSKLDTIDLKEMKLFYSTGVVDDEVIIHLHEVIDYSIPLMEKEIDNGDKIYDFIEEQLNIEPVGIIPLDCGEGYLLLRNGKTTEITVYQYNITLYDDPEGKYKKVHTAYVASFTSNISNTPEGIKRDLIRANRSFPNPATYSVECNYAIPLHETLLPLAKRALVKFQGNWENG